MCILLPNKKNVLLCTCTSGHADLRCGGRGLVGTIKKGIRMYCYFVRGENLRRRELVMSELYELKFLDHRDEMIRDLELLRSCN